MVVGRAAHSSGLFARLSQWAPAHLIFHIAAILAAVIAASVLTRLLIPPAPSHWHQWVLLKNLLLPIGLFALYARLVRLTEKRSACEIDLRKGVTPFMTGALLGVAMMGTFFLILWGLGNARITPGTESLRGLATELLVPMVTAMIEELLFRTVLFRILEEISGTTVAVVISAIVFAMSHAVNPGATPFAIAVLSIDMGVVLALAYALTRNVWFAVGIHMSWNFAEGYIFGSYDSGVRDPHSLFRTVLSGSDLLTGGSFGPEGSIVMLGLGAAVTVILVGLILRRDGWRPPRLQLRPVS